MAVTVPIPVTSSVYTAPLKSPIKAIPGTSFDYRKLVEQYFIAPNIVTRMQFNRSNATVAMSDKLPNPQSTLGNNGALENGWSVLIRNTDASATITITPASGVTVNGGASATIAAGNSKTFYTDGINWFF